MLLNFNTANETDVNDDSREERRRQWLRQNMFGSIDEGPGLLR